MIVRGLCALSTLLLLPSCLSVSGGAGGVEVDGIVNGYVSTAALRPYDGDIINLGVFDDTHEDELLSFDLWPIVGFGVGIAGARLRVLPLELAIGTLFYDPDMPDYSGDDVEEIEEIRPDPEPRNPAPRQLEEVLEPEQPREPELLPSDPEPEPPLEKPRRIDT